MSFDLKLSQGGLVLDGSGDIQKVEKNDKLQQDLLKIIITPLGANRFFPWYGSKIGGTIGNVLDINFSNTFASSQLKASLETLKKIQSEQEKIQYLSPEEQLAAVRSALIKENSIDPRYINVFVNVVNKAFQSVNIGAAVPTL